VGDAGGTISGPGGSSGGLPRLRDVWQLPALLAAAGLLAGGAYVAVSKIPEKDAKGPLVRAREELEAGKFEQALTLLNAEVRPLLATKADDAPLMREYHLLVARSIWLGQREKGIDHPANHENAIKSFDEAKKLDAELTPQDLAMIARSKLALGKVEEALEQADALPAQAAAARVELYREIVDKELAPAQGVMNQPLVLDVLTRMLGDSTLEPEDRAWALSRQTELQMAQGFAEMALTRLLREMPRVQGVSPRAAGELHYLLGLVYSELESPREAEKQLTRAAELIPTQDVMSGRVELLLAQVAVRLGEANAALERYQRVRERFGDTDLVLDSMLGIGESEASLGNFEGSLAVFGELVASLKERGEEPNAAVGAVAVRTEASLLARHRDRFQAGDFETALKYAERAVELTGIDASAPEVLSGMASTRRALAEELLRAVLKGEMPDPRDVAGWMAKVDPATQRQAQEHFLSAGVFYREYARRVVVSDAAAYAEALWNAADSFDRAGDQESAIALFLEFIESFGADERQPEAKFRLARAYQSRGEYELASKLYEELIETREMPGGQRGAGAFADQSFVPLAQTLLLDADDANDSRAEDLLSRVLSGEIVGPETSAFLEALIELGGYYHAKARYEDAIGTLSQAVERIALEAGKNPATDVDAPAAAAAASANSRGMSGAVLGALKFKLAESLRLQAVLEGRRLESAMGETERRELMSLRADRLKKALKLYDDVRDELERKDARRRTGLEELSLRNSYFYRADSAFELGDYETAVAFYQAARDKYPNEPASLVALTQIVNIHLKQGDTKRAATANERAVRFFKSLPESVWDDPKLPMTRADWERWLSATVELSRLRGEITSVPESPEGGGT
jgi:tetratricopeptide (TPR) repeat protein